MDSQIELSLQVLREFQKELQGAVTFTINREDIVAHATLSGLSHHWPSRSSSEIEDLLEATVKIKELEHSRWAVQRRIAIAKLQSYFSAL